MRMWWVSKGHNLSSLEKLEKLSDRISGAVRLA